MNKQQIVFINQSSGYLQIDIIHSFEDIFDERVLIAGFLNPRNEQLDPKVTIKKIIQYDRSSSLKRLWTWTIGFLQILYVVKVKYRNAHLFIVSNPPFNTFLPKFCNNDFSLLLYDIYPDALVQLKILKEDSFFINLWKKANKSIYQKATKIYSLSDGMKKLISQYVPEDKIEIVPIWTDNQFLKPIPKNENSFRTEVGLQDKFIVMYSGNLGRTHDIETIVELATHCKNDDVYFLIIGEGDKKDKIKSMIEKRNLENISMLPWQPTEKIPLTMSAADIAVITLAKDASNLSVPSKTYNFMSVGVPLLCVADNDTELYQLVKENKLGQCCKPEQIEEMLQYINDLSTNKQEHISISQNGLNTSKLFGKKNSIKFTFPFINLS